MSTFPFDHRLRRFGIVLALYPSSNELAMQIQRAPDSAGSPDTGNAEIIDVVAPGTRTYPDYIGGTQHYRHRHISASGTTGDWTHWVSATATNIPATLPNVPKLRDPSIAIEETVGSSSFTVAVTITDPDRRLASEPAFQTRTGVGAYGGTWLTSWDTTSGTIGTDGTITRSEPVSFGATGRASLKLRVQWYDDAGEQQERIEHVELNNENALKSANLRWVPRQVTTWTAYDCYADLQLLADVQSVHWSAVGSISGAQSGNEDISADGSILLFASAVGGILQWLRGETITVTFTPYDAVGGDGGAGDAGPSVTRVIEPWDETGSTGARVVHEDAPSSVFDGDMMVVAGSGASLDQDSDGRPRLTVAGVASSTLTDISDVTITMPGDGTLIYFDNMEAAA